MSRHISILYVWALMKDLIYFIGSQTTFYLFFEITFTLFLDFHLDSLLTWYNFADKQLHLEYVHCHSFTNGSDSCEHFDHGNMLKSTIKIHILSAEHNEWIFKLHDFVPDKRRWLIQTLVVYRISISRCHESNNTSLHKLIFELELYIHFQFISLWDAIHQVHSFTS